MGCNAGCIFNIQKFSIHDGPGIRTVVFLKGCPLRCTWCANPESQSGDIQILWDEKKCNQCRRCVDVCPAQAISIQNGKVVINEDTCIHCLKCVEACPQKALSYEGEIQSCDEIMKEVLKDKDFYEESGGGMTLSGGEVFAQPDFARELLRKAKGLGIHTALETTGYTSEETFRSVIPFVDLLLFDVKHYDTQKHFEKTQVHNEQIIQNLKVAQQEGKEVVARIPIIPGFNDTLEDAQGFSDLLQTTGIQRVDLLPFHQFGENKHHLLGKKYEFEHVKALHPEDFLDYQDIFIQSGFDCKI